MFLAYSLPRASARAQEQQKSKDIEVLGVSLSFVCVYCISLQ